MEAAGNGHKSQNDDADTAEFDEGVSAAVHKDFFGEGDGAGEVDDFFGVNDDEHAEGDEEPEKHFKSFEKGKFLGFLWKKGKQKEQFFLDYFRGGGKKVKNFFWKKTSFVLK